jgi:hypothetical protein
MKDGGIVARDIPSSDVLAICLIFADCDLDISMGKVIQRADEFEESEHRFLGTSLGDFRMSFYWLVYNLNLIENLSEFEELVPGLLEKITLREWIKPILHYNDLYFNDEGEFWTEEKDNSEYFAHNSKMREFFIDTVGKDRQSVRDFLRKQGIDKGILYEYSHPY